MSVNKVYRLRLNKVLPLWVLLVLMLTLGINLLGQDKIYYSDQGNAKVQQANPDGTGIVDIATGVNEPTGIAVDNANGKIYYCDDTNNKIVKANLDGTSPADVVTGLTSPNGIALDVANGYIYWSDNGTTTIKRADSGGLNQNVTDIVTGQTVAQIALDTANNHIYFADQNTKIRRADLDGTNKNVTDIITGLTNAYGLALDLTNSMLYFSDYGALRIAKRGIAGGAITDVVTSLADVDHISLDTKNGVIYFATFSDQKIRKVNFDGTGLANVIGSGLGNTTGIAFYTPPIVAPTVNTPTSASITSTSATLGGNVANTGGENVTERGVYWSTTNGFTPPGQGTKVSASGSWGTGTFTVSVNGLPPNSTIYFKAFATNSAGSGYSAQASFTTQAIPPVVTTNAASGVGTTGATLNGTVNANNASTTVTFEYGLTTSYGTTVTADQSPVTGMTATAVSKAISGLTPNTLYHYRAVGQNTAGTTNGGDMTFTTSAAAPAVTTNAASGVSSGGATLNGTVNANNSSTTVTFEYGPTASYGTTVTADQSPVSGTTNTAVSKAITGLAPNATYHYRVVGQNGAGTSNGADMTFTTSAAAPTVTTGAASAISTTGATLNGTVNANNSSTTVTFEYGLTTSYGTTVTADQSPVTGTSNTAVSKAITGLTPNTTYHYRAVGQNGGGTTNGADMTFTTSAAAPTVTTNAASGLGSTGATLNGTVNANNASTTVTFEYGLTTSYGTTVTADQSPVTGTANTAVSKAITGLTPNTTYHYRAVGQNTAGTSNGADMTFTTSAAAPTVTTGAASAISTTGATLNGTVNANNDSTTVTFEYGLTTSYGTTVTADQSPVTGTTDTAVSKAITGLTPNTTYHYRAVGQNGGGTTNGADMTFTTSAAAPTVTTNAASGVGTTGATLNGTVNANNASTTLTFEYGLTASYGTTVTADQSPVTGTTNTAVSKAITGLTPNTTYHYRAVGQNTGGTTNGADMTFTTGLAAPTVTTNAASGVSTTGATLNGTVNANNASTTVTFEYGLDTSYGTTVTADQSPVSGTTDTAVSKAITGLTPNTTYHYRVVGQNGGGTTNGADMTFITTVVLPTVTTRAITNVTPTSAVSGGNVTDDGGGTVTARGVCWSTSTNPTIAGNKTTNGTGTGAFTSNITGLLENTTYYVRAYATNSAGTAYGNQLSFTTNAQAVTVTITEPEDGARVSGTVLIKADASANLAALASANAAIQAVQKVEFYVDDTKIGEDASEPYETSWDTTAYSDGSHTIKAVAYDTNNQASQDEITVQVVNGPAEPPEIMINRTRLNFGSTLQVGNALSSISSAVFTTGPQTILINNLGGGTLNWTVSKDADWLICTPGSGNGNGIVSVSVVPAGLPVGTYAGTISIQDPAAVNSPVTVPVTLKIYGTGTTTSPFGYFETPTDGATVQSSVPVTGWVLDDIEVTSIKIYRAPIPGHETGMIYIGDAVQVDGARPDVEQTFPDYPKNYQAGWGYMLLTNFLPFQGNRTFTLYAIAMDKEGNEVILGSKTITGDNAHAVKPFGAIDTPGQGGIASGKEFVNFGWALTPQPNTVPTDGSTIIVWVDGVPLGNPVYNSYREDIVSLFPGYNNSNGAGGNFFLDTTKYLNGVHTIAWSVKDDAGNQDGVGSRFFTIQNIEGAGISDLSRRSSLHQYVSTAEVQGAALSSGPVYVITGYNRDAALKAYYPGDDGIFTIGLKEGDRIEILPGSGEVPTGVSTTYGYMLKGDRLQLLPGGSFMDNANGIFYWQVGAGFFGKYQFVFAEKSADGQVSKKLIHLVVNSKY